VVHASRANNSARSTERTWATPGDGGTRRSLRGDTGESAGGRVDCRRASVHGDIGLDHITDNIIHLQLHTFLVFSRFSDKV